MLLQRRKKDATATDIMKPASMPVMDDQSQDLGEREQLIDGRWCDEVESQQPTRESDSRGSYVISEPPAELKGIGETKDVSHRAV